MERRKFLILAGGAIGWISTISIKPKTANVLANQLQLPPKQDVRLVVISDLNSQYGSTEYEPEVARAISLILQWKPDLVLCGGDAIAGQKTSLTEEQIIAMWKAFDRQIGEPLRSNKIPFGFTIGNHDGSSAIAKGQLTYLRERELASAYWQAPEHHTNLNFIDRTNFPFYYSFQQQDIFYLVWDASSDRLSEQQLTWVEKTLNSKRAQQAKMRMAIGHLPLYGIAKGRDRAGEFLKDAPHLQQLLEKYRVHTYISGHDHAYYPGKNGKLQLLHAGALGSGPRQLLNSDIPPYKTITIVDIEMRSSSTTYNTYDMKNLAQIDMRALPEKIIAPNGIVLRRDKS
jgi:hypothetical protein